MKTLITSTTLLLVLYITGSTKSIIRQRESSSFFPPSMAAESNSEAMQSDDTSRLTILVERNPPESRLSELGIKSWPKWGCPPGKFSLKFDAEETCYLLKGKVRAYTKGCSECVEFGARDLVIIPKGISCTWDVSVAVDKYYKFDSSN